MADHADFDTPDSPPPPAYEFCQQEFDQKVSHALEASQAEPPRESAGEDEWEAWDETIFAAAAARLTLSDASAGAGSSTYYLRSPHADASVSHLGTAPGQGPIPGNGKARSDGREDAHAEGAFGPGGGSVQPLRIVKKATPLAQPEAGSAKEKERPSWYAEAQLDAGPPQDAPQPATSFRAEVHRSDSIVSRSDTPPPMFTPIGPSLDGPPYEGPPVVLTYVPGDSRPASPLHSPPATQTTFAGAPFSHSRSGSTGRRSLPQPPQPQAPQRSFSPSSFVQARPTHQSLPPPRPPPSTGSPRPTTAYHPKPVYSAPRVAFDPRMAYADAKSSPFDTHGLEPPPPKVNAAALYSSAVSSLYGSSVSTPIPRVTPNTTSSTLRPLPHGSGSPYSNPSAARSQSSYHLPQTQTAAPHNIGNFYAPSRENMVSPAPSERTIASNHSAPSHYSLQQTTAHHGHQTTQYTQRPGTGYQPTSYQAPPSHQRPVHPAAPSTYQPTTYQSSYQPTSY